jgi:hypothetical protein
MDHTTHRRLLSAGSAGLLLVSTFLGAGSVAATPSKWETFPLTCGETTFVVTASPGFWSSGKILDAYAGAHVVSYGYSIVVTDLDTNEILYQNAATKPGDRGQASLSCFDYTLTTDPDTGHQISVDFQTVLFIPKAA